MTRRLPDIKSEKQSNEDARDDNVSQTQHCKVVGWQAILQQILGEHHCNKANVIYYNINTFFEVKKKKNALNLSALTFDWCFKWFGHSYHDISAKHLEGKSHLIQNTPTLAFNWHKRLNVHKPCTWNKGNALNIQDVPRRCHRWRDHPTRCSQCSLCSAAATLHHLLQMPAQTGCWQSSAETIFHFTV